MKSIYDVAVIGGGISGVSFAFFASKFGKKVLLLEKKETLGGAINSYKFQDDFFIELGAHTCYNSYVNLTKLICISDLKKNVASREKHPYKFLKEHNLESIQKQIRWLELFSSLPNMFLHKKKNRCVEEFYSKILGRNNYSNFARKFFSAVICQNPDNYPAELFLKIRSKKDKKFQRSFSFTGGINQLIDTLKNTFEYECKCEVVEIEFRDNQYFITLSTGQVVQAKKLVFATYPQIVSKLIRKINQPISTLLSIIKPNEVFSVGVICKKRDLKLPPIAGIIPDDNTFLSMVSRDVIPNDKFRGFTFHFDTQMATKYNPEQIILDVLNIKKEKIISKTSVRTILPILEKKHTKLVTQIDEKLRETPNLFIIGNYFEGMSLEDCLTRSKKEFLRMMEKSNH